MFEEPTTFNAAAERVRAHRRRCRALPPLQPGEHERLVAAFLAVRNITQCPVRYAVPLQHGPQLTQSI
jgi:hypothetical protein